MRPRPSTTTIAPPPVRGPTTRSRRQEVESGDEALEAKHPVPVKSHSESPAKPARSVRSSSQSDAESGDEAQGAMAQPPASVESHSESLAQPTKSSAQSDSLGMVDDEQTYDEVGVYGQDDYSDMVGYDENQGYYDISHDGIEQHEEEYSDGCDQPMGFGGDIGEDTGERTQPKRGRERAESGNPRVKKSGRQSIAHSNAPTAPPTRNSSPSQVEDLQGASRTTGGFIRGKATGGHFKWGDASQFVDHGSELQSAPLGKVLLYASRDEDANPHLSINTQTVNQLPPILKKLSAKYSPIRSKCIVLYN